MGNLGAGVIRNYLPELAETLPLRAFTHAAIGLDIHDSLPMFFCATKCNSIQAFRYLVFVFGDASDISSIFRLGESSGCMGQSDKCAGRSEPGCSC